MFVEEKLDEEDSITERKFVKTKEIEEVQKLDRERDMAPAWWESGFFGAFYISREETIYIKISAEFPFVSVFAQLSIVQAGITACDGSLNWRPENHKLC